MPDQDVSRRVTAVRRFNRFYTQRIGVLQEGLLQSPFSLTEVRVLYELAHREKGTASDLRRELDLDAGYLSRILRGFEKRGLIEKRPAKDDGRKSLLALTAQGRKGFAALDGRSSNEVADLLGRLSADGQRRLVAAMDAIQELLGARGELKTPYLLRLHQPGDMGWVVHRHGERVGSVFLVKRSKTVAQLRMLLVEPNARGLGIGARLVAECVRFARQAGYRKIVLWTNEVLAAARHLYEAAGFRLVRKERQKSFGHDLVFETWELRLNPS